MTIVIKVCDAVKQKMIDYYKDKTKEKIPPYAVFQAVEEDTTITLYESGKAMFQGISAFVDANIWREMNEQEIKQNTKEIDYYFTNALGSDEVGVGDYFGPIIITCAYVNKKDISFLESLNLKDSKKLSDTTILKIVPAIIKRIKYDSVILTNKEYNEKYSKDTNLNKIKAILHNKAITNMLHKHKFIYDYIIVDQFVNPKKYYEYLKESPQIVKNITFLTKAEEKNLSVACAAAISRYIFIKECDKLSKEVGIDLPKGAGKKVDIIGKEIVMQYGIDKLTEVAKYNFKNTEKIVEDN